MGISIDAFLHFTQEQEPHIRVKFNNHHHTNTLLRFIRPAPKG